MLRQLGLWGWRGKALALAAHDLRGLLHRRAGADCVFDQCNQAKKKGNVENYIACGALALFKAVDVAARVSGAKPLSAFEAEKYFIPAKSRHVRDGQHKDGVDAAF